MRGKKNIYLMYAIAFFQGMVLYATISTLYRESRGLDLSDYAVVESFSFLFTLIFEVPFGFIADRIGYKKTLVLANGVYFLSKIVFWQAYSFGGFLLERFLLAIAFAGISGVDTSIIYLSGGKEESHKRFGFYASFGTAGMLTGCAIFTLFLSDKYDMCAFWTAVAYGIAFILTLCLTEVKGKDDTQEKVNAKNLLNIVKVTFKDRRFLWFLLASALVTNAGWMVSVMLYQDKYLLLGINEQQMGVIAIVISVAGLFSFASSWFTKKLGVVRFMAALTLLMGLCALLMGYTEFAVLAIACHFMVDVGSGLLSPLLNEMENERVTVSDRATQLSVYGMIVDVISIGLSIVTSLTAKWSLKALFALSAGEFMIALTVFMIGFARKDKSKNRA